MKTDVEAMTAGIRAKKPRKQLFYAQLCTQTYHSTMVGTRNVLLLFEQCFVDTKYLVVFRFRTIP